MSEHCGLIDEIMDRSFLPGVLLRATISNGTIENRRVPELQEGYTVVWAEDLGDRNRMVVCEQEMPLLVSDRVAYRGQPIAVIVGPDISECMRIREAVDITYHREEPVTLDMLSEGFPSVGGSAFGEASGETDPRIGRIASRTIECGAPDEALADAFQVTEGEYTVESPVKRILEPIGAAASIDDHESHVWAPSRWLYHVRNTVASALGRSDHEIQVTLCDIESPADAFLWRPSLYAAVAAIASKRVGRPVRLLAEPGDVDSEPIGPEARIVYKTGLDREGTLVALQADIVADTGAYGLFGREYLDRLIVAVRDAYRCREYRIRGYVGPMHRTPSELYAGLGTAVACFATEVHAGRLAELSGEDPVTWRLRHLEDAGGGSGEDRTELLHEAARAADFNRKCAAYETQKKRRPAIQADDLPLRGIGIARVAGCGGFLGGIAPVSATVRVGMDAEGTVELASSTPATAAASPSIHQMVVAHILNLPLESVVEAGKTTGEVPDTGPAILGSDMAVHVKLIEQCAETLGRKRFRAPLPLEVKRTSRRKSKRQWNPDTLEGDPYVTRPEASMVVEVEVDPVSLRVAVKGIWATVSIGRIVDERLARLQFMSELAETFECCRNHEQRWEEAGMVDEEGRTEGDATVPTVVLTFIDRDEDTVQPIEGLAASVFPPAFVSAVSQATGFYFDTVPIGNDMLHRYLEPI